MVKQVPHKISIKIAFETLNVRDTLEMIAWFKDPHQTGGTELYLNYGKRTGTDEEALQCAFSVKKHHCTSADGTERCLFISLNRQFLFIDWLEWF